MAVDPSIHEGAFLLAGGDLSTILWQMPEGKAFRARWIERAQDIAQQLGETPVVLRKRLSRAMDRVTRDLGIDGAPHE